MGAEARGRARSWRGCLWSWDALGVAGVLLLLAIVATYVSLVLGRHGSWLAAELRVWALAYPLFLLAVVRPITSMWRFLMLDFPVAAIVVEHDRERGRRPARSRPAGRAGWCWSTMALVVGRHRLDRGAADRHPVVGLAALTRPRLSDR